LVVSLGPVQEFIASARRCQDLWFGSWVLSDLARATAEGIVAAAGEGSLVFPAALGDELSVANKIVAVLPEDRVPAEVAEGGGRASMMKRLEALATKVFAKLPKEGWDRELALTQVRGVMEYVWVAVPFTAGYAAARRQAEMLLSARKNTKVWGPVPWGPIPGRPKSSIDGLRESVLYESLYTGGEKLAPEELHRLFFVKKSERLCGVGLLKRVGQEIRRDGETAAKRPFHSTAHVAAGPLLARIERAEDAGRHALEAYFGTLRALGVALESFEILPGERGASAVRDPFKEGSVERSIPRTFGEDGLDGYLLFEDRLPEVLETYAPGYAAKTAPEREDLARRARAALARLLADIGQHGPPTPYYALLLADGDRMGKAIDRLATAGIDGHRALSRALEVFALGCRGIVERNGGSFVYSGGDDVLAFLPLHTALACADALQRSFGDTIRKECPSLDPVPTLSVGLGIAHALEAMTDVRALAKQAETAAKRERGSLGIAVSKRGGATLEIAGKWKDGPPLHQRLDAWCRLFRAEELPDGVAFELEEAIAPFEIRDPADAKASGDVAAFKDVILSLTRRVLGRKRSERGKAPLHEDEVKALRARFEADPDPIDAVKKLSHELQIARLFLAAYESAWGAVSR
jgi:CRISPR-associated protein Cmr2